MSIPHLDTCGLKYGQARCTCGLEGDYIEEVTRLGRQCADYRTQVLAMQSTIQDLEQQRRDAVHQRIKDIREIRQRREEILELLGALQELRIRLHADGRRPEECYEMSLIDEALRSVPHSGTRRIE
jgi:chromosome segregation ATPase